MKYALIASLAFVAACGSAPTAPTPTTTPIASTPPVVSAPAPPSSTSTLPTDTRFDLAFFKQFAHDAIDGNTLPLKRWTRAPLIYLRTTDSEGRAIDAALLDRTAAALINTTSLFTGGAFGVAGLERGTITRANVAGYITVEWSTTGVCGNTTSVGTEGTVITLNARRPECTCGPLVVKHELGHALGYYHTDNANDLMVATFTNGQCDKPLSARELYHAQVTYSRALGSLPQ